MALTRASDLRPLTAKKIDAALELAQQIEHCAQELDGILGDFDELEEISTDTVAGAIASVDGHVFLLLAATDRDRYTRLAEAAITAMGGEPA